MGGSKSALEDVTFGSIAGMTAKLFEHPFDLVKVRLQSQPTDRPLSFTGPVDCFRQTYGKEGLRGLYRGISAPIVGAAAENATLFLVYNRLQKAVRLVTGNVSDDSLRIGELAGCAAGAGAVTSFVLTPIELVKCRMQVQMLAREGAFDPPSASSSSSSSGSPTLKSTVTSSRHLHTTPHLSQLHTPTPPLSSLKPEGPFQLIANTVRTHGLRGLWLGQTGTLMRETGGSSAWFTAYELSTRFFIARREALLPREAAKQSLTKADLSTPELMLSGAAAGISYNVILFPADSIKSAMQTWAELHPHEKRLGFMEMGKRIWKGRGLRGLYAGCGLTCLRSGPSSAMIFGIYEALEKRYGGWA